MSEVQDRVRGARIFTKIDLKNGYPLNRITKSDEWKTAFRCCYGHYEFMVMPLRLTNAKATCEDKLNHILKDLLDKGVIVHIEDVLIYTKTTKMHNILVKEVLKRLMENKLDISPEKCICSSERVEFLGYLITPEGMERAEDTIEAITE
jgi:hypothetical protein